MWVRILYPVQPRKHEKSTQCWANAGPPFSTLAQHWFSIVSMFRVSWGSPISQGFMAACRHARDHTSTPQENHAKTYTHLQQPVLDYPSLSQHRVNVSWLLRCSFLTEVFLVLKLVDTKSFKSFQLWLLTLSARGPSLDIRIWRLKMKDPDV